MSKQDYHVRNARVYIFAFSSLFQGEIKKECILAGYGRKKSP